VFDLSPGIGAKALELPLKRRGASPLANVEFLYPKNVN